MGSAEKIEYNSKGRTLKHTGLLRTRYWCEEALMTIVEQGEASTPKQQTSLSREALLNFVLHEEKW